jgi:signal peptidase II
MTKALARYRRFWFLYLAVLVIDQITKISVLKGMPVTGPDHPGYTVVPGFFRIVHVYNKGAAWSMLAGNQGWLVLLAVGALGAMYRWRKELGLEKPFVQYALGAFAGGAIGNVIDRMAYDHVVDFLAFRLIRWDYPVFNVADIGITVGAALYCWHGFREKPEASAATPASDA